MAKQYKGSLSLEWFNKQKSIVSLDENSIKSENDIPAPRINWINKEEALFYELNQEEGKGNTPYWVNRDDIRVKEARPLVFQKAYRAVEKDKKGTIPGTDKEFVIEEITKEADALDIDNILIKGDNLLALNTLKKHFDKLPANEKLKCVCIDPPFNSSYAFEHYEDNLEHSEWLTLMRDRLSILHTLLREDGVIFVILDDKEAAYCKILLDDIFGRNNYCNEIIVKTSSSYGFKSTSKDLLKQANHIFFYTKDKESFNLKKIYTEKEYDSQYKFIFYDTENEESKWKWMLVRDYFALQKGEDDYKKLLKRIGEDEFNNQLFSFILSNAERVFRTASVSGGALQKRKATIALSKTKKDEIIRHPNDDMDYMFIGGERVIFYNERLVEIDGIQLPGEIITDLWTDIPIEGLASEGGVDFPKGKKPEKLIHRLIELSTDEGDKILDCFGGSGTTFAVAHKMNRKWIGVEMGNQADSHIIPRLSNVILGEDQSGISKTINWQGGGSFKYYHLGESIINVDKDTGKGEFNWSLGKQFIQESLLVSLDLVIQKDIEIFPSQIFKDDSAPTVGKLSGKNNKSIYGLSFLVAPGEKDVTISNEEIKSIYNVIKKQSDFHSLVIYTNKGIDIAQDSMPDDMDIIKVPHAIFAELER